MVKRNDCANVYIECTLIACMAYCNQFGCPKLEHRIHKLNIKGPTKGPIQRKRPDLDVKLDPVDQLILSKGPRCEQFDLKINL